MAPEYSMYDDEDDFEIIDADLPLRLNQNNELSGPKPTASVELQSTLASNEFLLSIHPPLRPASDLQHTSCDIVLVIDVSGSMNAAAELPDQVDAEKKEVSGLNILDLVKHASRTIIEKLNENDRLAVVTFSTQAKVIQGLLPMTDDEKKQTWERIENLSTHNSTNLWAGIREGLNLFEKTERGRNVQGMFVLTDGVPNHMCPSQGYVKRLQPILKKMRDETGGAPTVSTFGFGYYLRSALMRSIAEVGRGYYAFIPDVGMIGTVFVHAVANLFSTFAPSVEIRLQCSDPDVKISFPSYLEFDIEKSNDGSAILYMSNLQYGQSRNVIFKTDRALGKESIEAAVQFQTISQPQQTALAKLDSRAQVAFSQVAMDYQISRNELCTFLASLSGKNVNNEHIPLTAPKIREEQSSLASLILRIEVRLSAYEMTPWRNPEVADLAALLADLKSSDPNNPHGNGQIALAMSTDPPKPRDASSGSDSPSPHRRRTHVPTYYSRWGMHYLPSILHSHMRQLCTTFKDPGPLRYGINSPLFKKCRDELDEAFDRLPAPKPSLRRDSSGSHRVSASIRMGRYHSVSNPCFSGECLVRMATVEDNIAGMMMQELRVGDLVWTPAGGRMVRAIVKTDVKGQILCKIGGENGLWVTPWHPIHYDGQWMFPSDVTASKQGSVKVLEEGSIYSVVLEKDNDFDAHVIDVGNVLCVTLGHGFTGTDCERNILDHPFFGNYDLVAANLQELEKDDCGRRVSGGVMKMRSDEDSWGLACKFVRSDEVIESLDRKERYLKARL